MHHVVVVAVASFVPLFLEYKMCADCIYTQKCVKYIVLLELYSHSQFAIRM